VISWSHFFEFLKINWSKFSLLMEIFLKFLFHLFSESVLKFVKNSFSHPFSNLFDLIINSFKFVIDLRLNIFDPLIILWLRTYLGIKIGDLIIFSKDKVFCSKNKIIIPNYKIFATFNIIGVSFDTVEITKNLVRVAINRIEFSFYMVIFTIFNYFSSSLDVILGWGNKNYCNKED